MVKYNPNGTGLVSKETGVESGRERKEEVRKGVPELKKREVVKRMKKVGGKLMHFK